ncbi:MAG: hypothetical protein Hyperionvirus14_23 [Hyperionvirus sp.]|uniref:Uncharacterized protein n=1 Tax=Hyperionvirus sp. TaxID=2487770 RepID=A0A3G5ABH5_9VIRU|nr:MAG: hypothetical protein Hyperionvirus14_23 [Hyperionvirus sp.]
MESTELAALYAKKQMALDKIKALSEQILSIDRNLLETQREINKYKSILVLNLEDGTDFKRMFEDLGNVVEVNKAYGRNGIVAKITFEVAFALTDVLLKRFERYEIQRYSLHVFNREREPNNIESYIIWKYGIEKSSNALANVRKALFRVSHAHDFDDISTIPYEKNFCCICQNKIPVEARHNIHDWILCNDTCAKGFQDQFLKESILIPMRLIPFIA